MTNITDLAEYRSWSQAKRAWRALHPDGQWCDLTEDERLAWKRAFEYRGRRG